MDDMEGTIFPDEEKQDSCAAVTSTPLVLSASLVDGLDDADFAVVLLSALNRMASRSKRRQADLIAALRGAGIAAEPMKIRAGLKILRDQGAIENLVPLSDGGLLLSVTQSGGDRPGPAPDWLALDELDATAVRRKSLP